MALKCSNGLFPKPRMYLNLLTSIRFLKNLRTSPKKGTYDDFIHATSSKVLWRSVFVILYLCDVLLIILMFSSPTFTGEPGLVLGIAGHSMKRLKKTVIFICVSRIIRKFAPHLAIGLWCNGNTTDSGPVIPSSNLGSPTKIKAHRIFL